MKRYLMRGGMSPLDNFNVDMVNAENLIGANSGNLLYAFGVYRTLMTEDSFIDMDYYGVERNKYGDAEIEEINRKYTAYICPLADAFRDAFAGKLVKYANFFDKLTIPVYVIGMGLRSPLDQGDTFEYPFDNEAKQFGDAARRKGTILGLRGEITGNYLKYLGYEEGKDYRVIGCPSMYTFGRELPRRKNIHFDEKGELLKSTKISFNASSKTPTVVYRFLDREMKRFPEHWLVEQNESELRLLYYGIKYKPALEVDKDIYPLTISHPLFKEDRYRIFINVKSWFEFERGMDLSIGCKLHGNVAAVISGCPAVFIPIDGRMRELIAYHKFPTYDYADINENTTIEEILSKIDFEPMYEAQAGNFERFVQFLDDNGLDHIYKKDINRKDAFIDRLMANIEYPLAENILTVGRKEMIRRFNAYADNDKRIIANLKKKK